MALHVYLEVGKTIPEEEGPKNVLHLELHVGRVKRRVGRDDANRGKPYLFSGAEGGIQRLAKKRQRELLDRKSLEIQLLFQTTHHRLQLSRAVLSRAEVDAHLSSEGPISQQFPLTVLPLRKACCSLA